MLVRAPVGTGTHRAAGRILVAVVLAVVVAGCAASLPSSTATDAAVPPSEVSATLAPLTPSGSTGASASATPPAIVSPAPPHDIFEVMTQVIVADRPLAQFELEPNEFDGNWDLDGNVTDAFGVGRLLISVTGDSGAITGHPCADRDFNQGGPCSERLLGNGNVLVLRDIVEAGGVKTIEVVLIHPDRSGISAEAANFTITLLDGPLLPRASREPVTATREDPPYTVSELAELVIAIDARIRDCSGGTC